MCESAEQERILREGHRIRQGVYAFFRNAHQELVTTVQQYRNVCIDAADVEAEVTGERTPVPSRPEIQAVVNSLANDGYMILLPRNGGHGPQYYRPSGRTPGPA